MSPAILANMAAWVTLVGYFKMLAFGFIGLFGIVWTADPAPAQAILKGYPVGGQVPVFYDPSNPKNSALVPGGSRGNWYFLLLGLVFMAAGALGLLRRW